MNSIQLSLFDGKVCSRCGHWLPQHKFSRNVKCPGDREPACKLCYRSPEAAEHKKARDREYYREHRQRIIDKTRRYAKANADQLRLKGKEWRTKTRDTLLPKKQAYRARTIAADPEGFYERKREQSREYRQKYPDRCRASYHNAMAKRRKAPGRWTAEQWEKLLAYYGPACLCCGKVKKLFRDHVLPLAKGGTNDIGNLQPLCHNCNSRKHTDATDYRPDGGAFARSLMP